ncbi:hypothetical protein vBVcaS_HC069 [Vibrio phage vB_VcaS_HC]|nr:hypothetical protein vBVcaS_HC069 [Vibrio phage vB_VcaS_HC]
MKKFGLFHNGKRYAVILATGRRDPSLVEIVNSDKEFYRGRITCKEIK